ncbi:hypothetical protein H6G27_09940 [Nostoc linckia FACHB-104]|nr:hypothetical protein [Nostoc linckia FACHB-104]
MPTGTIRKSKCNNTAFWYNFKTGQSIAAGSDLSPKQKQEYEYFDSKLEFQIYGYLVKKYGATFVTRQLEIPLLYGNEFFPPLTWKIDFAVLTPNALILIEAKGEWLLHDKAALSDFRKTLRILQTTQPEHFKNLKLVGDSQWKLPGTYLIVEDFRKL